MEELKLEHKKNVDEQIMLLQQKFKNIKKLGYVESVSNNINGVGVTFEKLIGKKLDSSSKPDFFDIEIKTKLSHSKSKINLINIKPTGPTDNEIDRLKNIYGYKDKKDSKLKTLNIRINGNKVEKVRNTFLFKLEIDKVENRLYIVILDINLDFIEKRVYWDLDIIKDRLYQKLSILALIDAFSRKKNNITYFKYYKINFFVLKDFSKFINLIEDGKIGMAIKIGNYYSEDKYGKTNSHGIGFIIKKDDIHELFDIYR